MDSYKCPRCGAVGGRIVTAAGPVFPGCAQCRARAFEGDVPAPHANEPVTTPAPNLDSVFAGLPVQDHERFRDACAASPTTLIAALLGDAIQELHRRGLDEEAIRTEVVRAYTSRFAPEALRHELPSFVQGLIHEVASSGSMLPEPEQWLSERITQNLTPRERHTLWKLVALAPKTVSTALLIASIGRLHLQGLSAAEIREALVDPEVKVADLAVPPEVIDNVLPDLIEMLLSDLLDHSGRSSTGHMFGIRGLGLDLKGTSPSNRDAMVRFIEVARDLPSEAVAPVMAAVVARFRTAGVTRAELLAAAEATGPNEAVDDVFAERVGRAFERVRAELDAPQRSETEDVPSPRAVPET